MTASDVQNHWALRQIPNTRTVCTDIYVSEDACLATTCALESTKPSKNEVSVEAALSAVVKSERFQFNFPFWYDMRKEHVPPATKVLNRLYKISYQSLRNTNTRGEAKLTVARFRAEKQGRDDVETATGDYELTMEGPFLLLTAKAGTCDYQLFTPVFMARRLSPNQLELMPTGNERTTTFILEFASEARCFHMHRALLRMRTEIEAGDYPLIPITLEVSMREFDMQGAAIGEHVCDIELSQQKRGKVVIFRSKDKGATPIAQLRVGSMLRVYLPTPDSDPSIGDCFRTLVCCNFAPGNSTVRHVIFKTRKQMYFTFLTMWIEIDRIRRERMEQGFIEWAQRIPTRPVSEFEEPRDLFRNEEMRVRFPVERLPEPSFSVPIFPPRGERVEPIWFGGTVRRRVIVVRSDEKERVDQVRVEPVQPGEDDFSGQVKKLREQLRDSLPEVAHVSRRKPFDMKPCVVSSLVSDSFAVELDGSVTRKSFARVSRQRIENMGYNYPEYRPPIFYGSKVVQEIDALSMRIPLKCEMTNSGFRRLVALLGSLFAHRRKGEVKLPDFGNPVVKPCLVDGVSYGDYVLSIGNLLYQQLWSEYLIAMSNTPEWILSNYENDSPFCDWWFLERLYNATLRLTRVQFSGVFGADDQVVLCENHIPVLREIVNDILDEKSREMSDQNVVRLLAVLFSFFGEGFCMPGTVVVSELRSPWYLFSLASSSSDKHVEIVVMQRVVDDLIGKMISDPRQMLVMGILEGLRCSLLGDWIVFCAKIGEELRLYRDGAPMLDHAEVTQVAEQLFSIADMHIGVSNETILAEMDRIICDC